MIESHYLENQPDLIKKLKFMPTLSELDQESFQALIRFSKIRKFSSHEYIIREGVHDQWIYFLIRGQVVISKNGAPLASLNNYGELFGEMSMIDNSVRSASIAAATETVCLASDIQCLEQLKADQKYRFGFHLYKSFSKTLSDRVRWLNEQKLLHSDEDTEQFKQTDFDDQGDASAGQKDEPDPALLQAHRHIQPPQTDPDQPFKINNLKYNDYMPAAAVPEADTEEAAEQSSAASFVVDQSIIDEALDFYDNRSFIVLKNTQHGIKIRAHDQEYIGRTGVGGEYLKFFPLISRHHTRMLFNHAQWFIEDLGALNGTYVNYRKLSPGERRAVQCGDIISLSNLSFAVIEA